MSSIDPDCRTVDTTQSDMPSKAPDAERHLSPRVTRNSRGLFALLLVTAMLQCTAQGYDCSMMNGLNILSTYADYFHLNPITIALNTSIIWIGQFFAGPPGGWVADRYGRKMAMLFAAVLNVIASILQTAAQNMAMFIIARLLIGVGSGIAFAQVPGYIAEVAAVKHRGLANGLFNCSYLLGALIAAGVTYRLAQTHSTWSWRGPSIVQGLLSLICILVLPFLPESPRWLVSKSRHSEALEVLAAVHTDGEIDAPIVYIQYREIVDTLDFERAAESEGKVPFWQLLKMRGTRRRLAILVTLASVSMLSGNNFVSYYLGPMLKNAGITNTDSQLIINIILNAISLFIALTGTLLLENIGRKNLGLLSMGAMTIFMFILGTLSKVYGEKSSNRGGIYATVATIFLFLASYCLGMTPLKTAYSPEVINFTLRAQGLGFFTSVSSGFALFVTFSFPIALSKIGYKTYLINGAWNVVQVFLIWYFWVETRGKTMEEIDEMIDGEMHFDGVALENVLKGKVVVDIEGRVVDEERAIEERVTEEKRRKWFRSYQ